MYKPQFEDHEFRILDSIARREWKDLLGWRPNYEYVKVTRAFYVANFETINKIQWNANERYRLRQLTTI